MRRAWRGLMPATPGQPPTAGCARLLATAPLVHLAHPAGLTGGLSSAGMPYREAAGEVKGEALPAATKEESYELLRGLEARMRPPLFGR
jgi:hypothetical protein